MARDVVGLHLWVSAAPQNVASGIGWSWGAWTRTDGAATIGAGAVGGDVGELHHVCLCCGPKCSVAGVEDLADHKEGAGA